MKALYGLLGVALVLSACSSDNGTEQASSQSSPSVDINKPLSVPDASQIKDTAARPLSGSYSMEQWSNLPGWQADDAQHLWTTLYQNCRGLMRPISGSLSLPARATPAAWQPLCKEVAQLGPNINASQAKQFLEQHLQPWKMAGEGLATGYYEPITHGSRKRHGEYQWPMYGVPSDLLNIDLGALYPELAGKRIRGKIVGNKVVPYETREQIAQSENKPPVIAWLNDPVEAFFLQVQGSGRVKLDDGSSIRLAYANHNGHPYTSIGRWLVDQGELTLSEASMQNIKKWAKANPGRVNEMLNANQAMVFFREEKITDESAGPKGAYSIPLTAQRSVAVDPKFVPLGTPLFLSTTYPASNKPLQRVVFAQDTGSAIKGASRVDFFWGSGDEAGQTAGRMKQKTQVWLLWPKGSGEPSAR